MIQPTMGYCTKSQYEYFMKNVNDWEKNQIKKGVYLIKIFVNQRFKALSYNLHL